MVREGSAPSAENESQTLQYEPAFPNEASDQTEQEAETSDE